MKECETKVKQKTAKAKKKIANAKRKVAAKTGKTVAALALLGLAFAGCATSEPASRATSARYGDIIVRIDDGAHDNSISLTIGDGAIASADSAGSTETTTSSPVNDVKPDVDVSVPVNKAGAAQSVGSVIGDAVASLVKGAAEKCAGAACQDGGCEDGSCSE